MSFPRYPKYKASGVEWLGEVPAHWEVLRLRHALMLNPSKSEASSLDPASMVSFLPMEAIGEDGSLDIDRQRPLAEVGAGYSYFRDGDVVIAKITPCFENGKGALMRGLHNSCGFGTTELIVMRPLHAFITPEFLIRLVGSDGFRKLGEASMYGAGGQKRVPDDFVRDFRTPLPPLPEQRAIAAFLDRETAKIDALIAEQEKLIALLAEKRQAVISHAVTKGLNPNAPMKPSGVEWLGEVPAHWEVTKLRFLCDVQTGTRDTEHAVEDGIYPFFVRSQTVERIDSRSFDCEAVLTAGDGAGVGKVFHYYSGPFDFHQRVYMLNNFRGISGRFCFHYLKANFYKVALEGGAKSTVDSLRRPMFLNFCVCEPPAAEQDLIVSWIERESVRIDLLATEVESAITLLRERRAALISAAVTGQIDVRHLAPEAAA